MNEYPFVVEYRLAGNMQVLKAGFQRLEEARLFWDTANYLKNYLVVVSKYPSPK